MPFFHVMPNANNYQGSVFQGVLRSCLAEFVAMIFFVYIGPGTVMSVLRAPAETNLAALQTNGISSGINGLTPIALAFGFGIAVLIHNIGHISGGHINPAVSTGLLVTGKISLVEWVCYVISQMIGAITGAGLLQVSFDDIAASCNGVPVGMSVGEAFLMEAILTALLMFTVMATVDPSNKDQANAPLSIGLSVVLAHLVAITSTGTSINPARSFGPAVIVDNDACWDDHWVFWVAPITGAIIMALLYQLIFDVGRASEDAREVFDGDREKSSTARV